jgi:hypothetical protein
MNDQDESLYQCVGICMADPDSGYCLGCGRPPLSAPGIVAELVVPTLAQPGPRDGTPEKPE